MMSNNKPTKNKPIKMQTNHLQQTVKDPLMILNTVREPQNQLLHHTYTLLGERERELRVQPQTLSSMTLQHHLMAPKSTN